MSKCYSLILVLCVLMPQPSAEARAARTVRLADGEMEPIYVESGFSTLLKFSSHPEPGLIGDQDGFKVEYMKNIVAIKPLVAKGKTNLFVFTKDGQFNFQLIASRGRHDNLVYVEPQAGRGPNGPTSVKTIIALDDLLTKKINKSAASGHTKLTLVSVAMPQSRSTIILKLIVAHTAIAKKSPLLIPSLFTIKQGDKTVQIDNVFLQSTPQNESVTDVLILLRMATIKKNEPLKIIFSLPKSDIVKATSTIQLSFSAAI